MILLKYVYTKYSLEKTKTVRR